MTDINSKKSVAQLQKLVIDGLEDVKAQDIKVFNTENLSPLFERVIIASGTSNRQTKALASSVRDVVREAGFNKPRVEGEENGEWIIVDCGAVVAHIMQPAIRQYYHLEEIWGEKPVRIKHGEDKMSELVKEKVAKPGKTSTDAKNTKSAKSAKSAKSGKSAKPTRTKAVAKRSNETSQLVESAPKTLKKTSANEAKTAHKNLPKVHSAPSKSSSKSSSKSALANSATKANTKAVTKAPTHVASKVASKVTSKATSKPTTVAKKTPKSSKAVKSSKS